MISGYPSSGKSYRSGQLADYFKSKIESSSTPRINRLTVTLISDHALGLNRDVYTEAGKEKSARSTYYSAVKRALGRDNIVIADGMNYIKGYRYQMYCEAKAAQTPSCVVSGSISTQPFYSVHEDSTAATASRIPKSGSLRNRLTGLEVHIGTPIKKCQEINAEQLERTDNEGGYPENLLDDLIYRFEEPNGMTRWDSPLFTVPYDDETPSCDEIWEAMIGSEGNIKTVKPNRATAVVRNLSGQR